MSGSLTALPSEWVARLFQRFGAIYGNKAQTMWANTDPDELRQVWAEGLGGFVADDIREALTAMPLSFKDFPPTLPQFADLCKDARNKRTQTVPKVTGPRPPMPEHIRERLAAFKARHVL